MENRKQAKISHLPRPSRGVVAHASWLRQMRMPFLSAELYLIVVVQNRYLTLYPLIMAGGWVVPQASWSHEIACNLPWTGSKTMGAGTGSPSTAVKVTLIWRPSSCQRPNKVVDP